MKGKEKGEGRLAYLTAVGKGTREATANKRYYHHEDGHLIAPFVGRNVEPDDKSEDGPWLLRGSWFWLSPELAFNGYGKG